MTENLRNWLDAGHYLKRALLRGTTLNLLGQSYKVCYEARRTWIENDYGILRELARDRRCIFDVGANKGITSLLMSSTMERTGNLYAFEASERACLILRENVSLNGLDEKTHVINSVVSDISGTVIDFFWDSSSVFASAVEGHASINLTKVRPLAKSTLALDDFYLNTEVRPDFVKIDVEGAERQVIRGMSVLLKDVRPTIFLEIHTLPEGTLSENVENILVELEVTAYKMYHLGTKRIVQDAAIFDGKRGRTFVLLVSSEGEIPGWLTQFDASKLP